MSSRLALLVFIGTLNLSALAGVARGECYTFFGISTCNNDDTLDYPFSVAWWFVNSLHQMNSLQKAMAHFDNTFIGHQVRLAPEPIQNMWKLAKSDLSRRFVQKVVQHFKDKDEPVDLLYDKDIDYLVLQQAFRIHYEEILNFLNDFIRTAELDDELREAADTYIQYIKFDEVMLRFAPDPTKNTVFELLRQGINWDA